jgi:hypothetical protein
MEINENGKILQLKYKIEYHNNFGDWKNDDMLVNFLF